VDAHRFEQLHAEHEAALREVEDLEGVLSSPDVDPPRLEAAVGTFLRYYESRLEPHMRSEAAEVYPLLDRYLSTETPAALHREQQTVRDLVAALRRLLVGRGNAETDETRVAAQDLAILLRELIRKEDRVYHPLLQRLLEGDRSE
jgi:hemerythrin-like domain-containing protein